MAEFLSSEIRIREEAPQIRNFPQLASAVLAIQGIAEKGPIFERTVITSYSEFEQIFGSYLASYQLAIAVREFFLNGGYQCHVSRVVHLTTPSSKTPASAAKGSATLQTSGSAASAASVTGSVVGPWALEPGDTLIISINGGGPATATFDAASASKTCVTTDTYDFSAGGDEALTLKIDRGAVQTITFPDAAFSVPAAATAEEVAQRINDYIYGARASVVGGNTVKIESDIKGTNSYVEITGGTANAILGFNTAEVQGTGDVGNIKAVTIGEVETLVEADVAGSTVTTGAGGAAIISTTATGSTKTIQVDVSSTADTVFGLDNSLHTGSDAAPENCLKMEGTYYGTYANNNKIKIADASNGNANYFNLYVLEGTTTIESFLNCTMDTASDDYALDLINATDGGSLLFTASDLGATGSPPRPANTSGATVSGGNDGLASLDDNDFIGAESGGTGLYVFNTTQDVTIMCCPDRTSTTFQRSMIDYCGVYRNGLIFAIIDPPASTSYTTMVSTVKPALISASNPEVASIYWPRVKIINPDKTIFGTGDYITIAASGSIAGMMSKNDLNVEEGPFHQPAGVEEGKPLTWVGVESTNILEKPIRDYLFPQRINPITYLTDYGYFVDGARTLKGDGNFPSVGERRGVSYIERLIDRGLQWVRHKNNTPALRQLIFKQVYALLNGWMKRGAFASMDPATAFFVDASDALNPPSVVAQKKVRIRIGLATNVPAEFIEFIITKDTRQLEQELSF